MTETIRYGRTVADALRLAEEADGAIIAVRVGFDAVTFLAFDVEAVRRALAMLGTRGDRGRRMPCALHTDKAGTFLAIGSTLSIEAWEDRRDG